jgi:hypothetical protein
LYLNIAKARFALIIKPGKSIVASAAIGNFVNPLPKKINRLLRPYALDKRIFSNNQHIWKWKDKNPVCVEIDCGE